MNDRQKILNVCYKLHRLVAKNKTINFKIDNRIKGGGRFIAPNTIAINGKERKNKAYLYSTILHEIKHLLNCSSYCTEPEIIKDEFLAERFALKKLKQYYPKLYKQYLNQTVNYWVRSGYLKYKWKLHYQAFMKIKEYKDMDL